MTGLSNLVRKLKKAVTGVEQPVASEKPFQWEPAPLGPLPAPQGAGPASLNAAAETKPEPPAAAQAPAEPQTQAPAFTMPPASPSPSWKRPQLEYSSVVGAEIPAEIPDFATVYQGAGVRPPTHGYGVDRVAQMLEHQSLSGLDTSVKASAVLAALDAAGVPIHDVVHDGLLRYKALVAFEAAKELELHAVRPRNEYRVEELRLAIGDFQQRKNAELESLTQEATAAVAALNRLKSRQRAEEERFHRALSLFVEPLPARVIPMTPKGEANGAEALPPKPELKLVFATPPVSGDADATHALVAPAEGAPATAPVEPPLEGRARAEPEPAPVAEARTLPRKEATVRLTKEQALAILAGFREGEREAEPQGRPPDAGSGVVGSEAAPPKDPTLRLTPEQAAAIVAGFREAGGETEAAGESAPPEPAYVEAAPEGEPGEAGEVATEASSQPKKDATIRLTPEQAAAIVAGFADEAGAAEASAEATSSEASETGAKAKDRTIRLTPEQAAAIVASFEGAEGEQEQS